ncbi:MAG TPA: hypothetical protein VIF09_23710 [Polyangiaceae bacterium]|jgi:hypothetical protein
MRWVALPVAAAGLAASLVARDASAVGTRTFELDTLDKLSGGDLAGVSVGSDGVVRAGWTLGDVPLPEGSGTTATCALELADGSILVGTGPASGGKVVRIAGDHAAIFADTHESAVNALAVDKAGVVYAATTSNRVYQVSQGRAEIFARLPGVDAVFALATDPRNGALYAGTGSEGKVMRVAAGDASTVFFKTNEPFVVSLAVGDDGAVYAGTSGKGLLYRIASAGRATVLFDFHTEDVHAIALGPNHSVWAIANEGGAPETTTTTTSSSHRNTGGRGVAGPNSESHGKPGKGSLWRFDAQGRPERLMHHDEFHYVSLALDDSGVPFVGTGAEGRVYSVNDAHEVALVADTSARQVSAIDVQGKIRFILGSDPGSFRRVLAVGGPDAVWTSKPLDAGLRARFGHMHWRGTGTLEVSTRSGDTTTPDATWSPWSSPVPDGGPAPSPSARFIQVRARLRDPAASITDVTVPFVTENLRAVVTEVTTRGRGGRESKDKDKDREREVPSSGGEPPRHDVVVHVSWRVDNPDNDELRYRVQFHREGMARWIDATSPDDVLTRSELDWDTASLPEGKYRVKVDASDELSNPPGDTMHFALETPPILVDNTPPSFKTLAAQGRRLRGEVVDGLGPIARVEVAVDGRTDWHPIAPADGIFDTADETLDADLSTLLPAGPGPHIVGVRAYDAAGNFVVRDVETP